ncbi:septal ring lytic transglycosylase RlpA family protein [bacterium]|nr:septal ring lytic transglycosylase RlpA family protein [candidate division CSSED10-310 bacterium]
MVAGRYRRIWRTRRPTGFLAGLLSLILLDACATVPTAPRSGDSIEGFASWYGRKYHGRRTASGERYDMFAFTAAHPTLPFGTRLRVTHENSGRSVIVRVNDRGPWVADRIIDLSYRAAKEIGMLEEGVAAVQIEILD